MTDIEKHDDLVNERNEAFNHYIHCWEKVAIKVDNANKEDLESWRIVYEKLFSAERNLHGQIQYFIDTYK